MKPTISFSNINKYVHNNNIITRARIIISKSMAKLYRRRGYTILSNLEKNVNKFVLLLYFWYAYEMTILAILCYLTASNLTLTAKFFSDPKTVSSPVFKTTPVARPRNSRVPRNTILGDSKQSCSDCLCVRAAIRCPVISWLSIMTSWESVSRMSAGTTSLAVRTTTSPTTRSLPRTVVVVPSRMTTTFVGIRRVTSLCHSLFVNFFRRDDGESFPINDDVTQPVGVWNEFRPLCFRMALACLLDNPVAMLV